MRRGVKWAVVAAATASVVALATWRSGIMARPQQSPGELARAEYDRRSMTPLRRLQRADFVGLLSKGELPAGRTISFCPHCGQDLTIRHCPACGSELEHDWQFCVTGGRSTVGG